MLLPFATLIAWVPRAEAQNESRAAETYGACEMQCFRDIVRPGARRADSCPRGGCPPDPDEQALGVCLRNCERLVQPLIDADQAARDRAEQEERQAFERRLLDARNAINAAIERERVAAIERHRAASLAGRQRRQATVPGANTPRECDPAPTIAVCSRRCDQGDGRACLVIGESLLRYVNGGSNSDEAMPWFQRGCDHDNARACAYVAFRSIRFEDQQNAFARGFALAQVGCQQGTAEDCTVLANLGYGGLGHTRDSPVPEVQANLRRACELGDIQGCFALVQTPYGNFLMQDQWGVIADAQALVDRMVQLAEARCARDHSRARRGCLPLAGILADRTDRSTDYDVSVMRRGYSTSSGTTMPALSVPEDSARGMRIYDESCRAGYRASCDAAAWLRQ